MLAALLASHLVGPAGRPPVEVDCRDIPALVIRLEYIVRAAGQTPDVQARAKQLQKYLRFLYIHECRLA